MAERIHLMVCAGTGCVSNKGLAVLDALREEVKKRGLDKKVVVSRSGCNGFCGKGPIVVAQPENVFYQKIAPQDVPELVEEHLVKGRVAEKFLCHPPEEKTKIKKMNEIPFFKPQVLIALRNRGMIDPENIDEYIARDGYKALAKAVSKMTPEEVISEIKHSGLRGRGGGGFPAGVKWETCRNAEGEEHYVVCNADEGDPGAFMDRSLIEGDPHSVLEGMAIGAYAIGAKKGYLYVRIEYPLAIDRFYIAVKQAREYGLLGENIFDSGFSFDVEVRRGAGAFVCGESTALMASLEGRPGEPRAKYIHTVERGVWNSPTCLNNVETWANVPVIVQRGAGWYNQIGTPGDVVENPWNASKGTKVFALAGKIHNTGLVEVPMGIPLRQMVYDIGGGIPDGRQFKAVQTGGPSGGFIPEEHLDEPVDFDRLIELGSMMGSGGMVVLDDHDCIVDVSKYFINFLSEESCGKCVPCREGLAHMEKILQRICAGKGTEADLTTLDDLSDTMVNTSLCALGGSAPNPVLSSLKYFRSEYEAHIRDKKCPAGICKALIQYSIDDKTCNGCHACVGICPTQATSGTPKQIHQLNQDLCIKCGACYDACKFDAIVRQ